MPSPVNPTPIPAEEYGEWDFSIIKNTASPIAQYCFRVVTQNGNEISYSRYAQIDTSDSIKPTITSFSPSSNQLLPIGNFLLEYEFNDGESGIDITTDNLTIQHWDGSIWGPDIGEDYYSLTSIDQT